MASRSRSRVPESNRMVACALRSCSRLFSVCGPCDHGRRYCGLDCARESRRLQQRDASRAYQLTDHGRRAHAARQARYRRRVAEVTQQSPLPQPAGGQASLEAPQQHVGDARAHGGIRAAPGTSIKAAAACPETRVTDRNINSAKRIHRCVCCGRETRFLRLRCRQRRRARKVGLLWERPPAGRVERQWRAAPD